MCGAVLDMEEEEELQAGSALAVIDDTILELEKITIYIYINKKMKKRKKKEKWKDFTHSISLQISMTKMFQQCASIKITWIMSQHTLWNLFTLVEFDTQEK